MMLRRSLLLLYGMVGILSHIQCADLHAFLRERGAVQVATGLLPTYRAGDSLYWEVADTLLHRDFSLFTTLLSTPASPRRDINKTFGYAGDMIGPVFFGLRRHEDELWLVDPQHHRVWRDATHPDARIAALTTSERLYRRLPIVAEAPGRVLIEVGDMLHTFPLFTLDLVSFDLSIGSAVADADRIRRVVGHADRMLLYIDRSYNSSMLLSRRGIEPYTGLWQTGLCISVLPDKPMESRPAGEVGYFPMVQEVFEHDQPGRRQVIVKKWNLEVRPEDRARYDRGELVRPVRPIVFYIDRNTPPQYVAPIMAGVRAWRTAFEQAGFKDAIDARLAPLPDEDSTFSMVDTRYPFISWKVSGRSNAYGPSPCSSRSAEISTCHVGIFSSVSDLSQQWYFCQCGASDTTAWNINLPSQLTAELVEFVVTHEVGHSLGLEHNYMGSSHLSLDEATDTACLSRQGISSSIMDYVRFNYALRPGDHATYAQRRVQVGDYDRFAIEWGYRLFPGKTEAERERHRKQWCRRQLQNPRLRYVSSSTDLYTQAEDLGNDHVVFNARGMENLRHLCSQTERWQTADPVAREVMRGRYHSMLAHYRWWMQQVTAHLGGRRIVPGNPQTFVAETAPYNRGVVQFIARYLLQPPVWLFSPDIMRAVGVNGDDEYVALCQPLVESLPEVLQRVAQMERADTAAISADEVADSFHAALFGSLSSSAVVSPSLFLMQRWYVGALRRELDARLTEGDTRLSLLLMRELRRITDAARRHMLRSDSEMERRRMNEIIETAAL